MLVLCSETPSKGVNPKRDCSLINMLTSSSAQGVSFLLLPSAATLFHSSNSWRSSFSTLSLSLVCLFLPYLLASFLPRLCEIDCAPLPSADAAVIEKHTLLRPRALPLSLSPSLAPIGWLIEVTSPYFSAWHPPSLSLSSCSVDSGHSFFTPSSTSCLL